MLKRCLVPSALFVALCISAAPAGAASTRAEYIGQVDSICQANLGSLAGAWSAYNRNSKRTARLAKNGSIKAFLTATKREAAAINALSQVHTGIADQIAAVGPPASDASLVAVWLNYRRQEAASEQLGAYALFALRISKYFKKLRQADAAESSARSAIAGFGFQVCQGPSDY